MDTPYLYFNSIFGIRDTACCCAFGIRVFSNLSNAKKENDACLPQSVDVKEDANEAMLRHMPGNLTSHDKR